MPPSLRGPAYRSLGHLMRTSMGLPCTAGQPEQGDLAGQAWPWVTCQAITCGGMALALLGMPRHAHAVPWSCPCQQVHANPAPDRTCNRAAASACTACATASDTMYCTNGRRCPGMASRLTAVNMRQPPGDSQRLPPRPAPFER